MRESIPPFLSLFSHYAPWYDLADGYKSCVDVATQLLQRFPRARFFALDQTPAWIVKTMELISCDQPQPTKCAYIPFLGKRYITDYMNSTPSLTILTPLLDIPYLEANSIKRYRALLSEQGLDPKTIITQHDKTFIVAYAVSGGSVGSFWAMMVEWARELDCEKEMLRMLDVVLLVKENAVPLQNIVIPTENIGLPITETATVSREVMEAMFRGAESPNASDRLVPFYAWWNWRQVVPSIAKENKRDVEAIEKALREEIFRRKQIVVEGEAQEPPSKRSAIGYFWAGVRNIAVTLQDTASRIYPFDGPTI